MPALAVHKDKPDGVPQCVLVTGGCGFIGSNFINELAAFWPNAKIINLDNLVNGCAENVVDAVRTSERYQLVCADYRNERLVGKLLRENAVDTVIHFAATSSVDESYAHPLETFDNNVTGAIHFLRACTQHKLRRFVHVSTDEVYGDSPLGANVAPKTECDPLEPTNPYSATKAAIEQVVHACRHSDGLPAIIVRMNNVYGPRQDDTKVVPKFVKQAMAGEAFTIAGNGSQLRNWLYVSDACAAIRRLAESGHTGEIYNIGTSDEFSVLDLAKLVHEIVAEFCGNTVDVLPLTVPIKDRPYNDRRYLIDTTKIKAAIGWSPKIKFHDGLRRVIEWYMKND